MESNATSITKFVAIISITNLPNPGRHTLHRSA
jgi:hypothetical protein